MYTDHILFLTGAIASVLFMLLMGYLLTTRRRNRLFQRILIKETEAVSRFETLARTQPSMTLESIMTELSDFTELNGETALDGTTDMNFATETNNATDLNIITGLNAFTDLNEATELSVGDMPPISMTSPTAPSTVPNNSFLQPIYNFDPEVLKGKYNLLGEIGGGGMSRVFLASKEGLGNEWIVKFVPSHIGELTCEAEILTAMNHISLPKIIDVFHDENGSYMVQSYIEGKGMNAVLSSMEGIHEFMIADWAQQLAQVLSYLHKNGPVYHLDLKPSNIMVTSDRNLVLIDFGISRRESDAEDNLGVTVAYAAPEQLKGRTAEKARDIIHKRFGGDLPEARNGWSLNERTDIYSFGVIMFEAVVGHIPSFNTLDRIRAHISPELCDIILKCLEVNPEDRYATVDEILADIHKHRTEAKPGMIRALFVRRAAAVFSAASFVLAMTAFIGGWLVMQQEIQATMVINPEVVVVSVQQDSAIEITRFFPNAGREQPINAAYLRWENTADGIAQLDGERVLGLNVGQTTIRGQYRNAMIMLNVTVVEPLPGQVSISQQFHANRFIQRFAGTAYRDLVDGPLARMEMIGPESMAVMADGRVYFTDRGRLRRITPAGMTETVGMGAPHLRAARVRADGNTLYVLTDPWLDTDESMVYALLRMTAAGAEMLFTRDAQFTAIRDFYVRGGRVYYIEWNYGSGTRLLVYDDAVTVLAPLPADALSLTKDNNGYIFIADSAQGNLLVYTGGDLRNLSGLAGERHFIDGTAPLFYRPTRLVYYSGGLYVWDFNVLRRLEMEYGVAQSAMSVAGLASPVYATDFVNHGLSSHTILPYSYQTDFVHTYQGILLSDPKRGVIWQISPIETIIPD